MNLIFTLLSIYIFLRTIFYGLYEYKENKIAGVTIFFIATLALMIPNIGMYL